MMGVMDQLGRQVAGLHVSGAGKGPWQQPESCGISQRHPPWDLPHHETAEQPHRPPQSWILVHTVQMDAPMHHGSPPALLTHLSNVPVQQEE